MAKIKGALLLLVNTFYIFCSLAMLAVNIVFSFSLTKAKSRGQLITGISAAESNTTTTAITADSSSTSPVTTSNLILYELTYGLEEFLDSFTHFKPVLQMILQSIVYIFLTDYLLVHPFSLLCGGRIVRDIAAVPLIREVDTSKWFLLRVILFSSGLHLIQSTIGFCVFNGRHLRQFYRWAFTAGYQLSEDEEYITKRSVFIILIYPAYYLFESMITFLFIYVMMVFRGCVRKIIDGDGGEEKGNRGRLLEEAEEAAGVSGSRLVDRLQTIRQQLLELSQHFKAIISRLSFPLTTLHLINIYLIICSLCYLIVPSSRYRFYSGIVFNFGIFALTRMLMVCYAGGLVTREMKNLKAQLTRIIPKLQNKNGVDLSWTAKEVKEIKRLKKKFTVTTIWGSLSVDPTAIWKMLGFSLSYVIMLIQTEDYQKFGISTTTTNLDKSNCTTC